MTRTTERLHPSYVQEEQRDVLDKQVQEKQQAKVQQQQAKVQDAEDLAAALKQHKLEEAKSAAARKAAALKSKALMANQVCHFCFHCLLQRSPIQTLRSAWHTGTCQHATDTWVGPAYSCGITVLVIRCASIYTFYVKASDFSSESFCFVHHWENFTLQATAVQQA